MLTQEQTGTVQRDLIEEGNNDENESKLRKTGKERFKTKRQKQRKSNN